MSLRGISEAAYRSVKICSLGQNRMSANTLEHPERPDDPKKTPQGCVTVAARLEEFDCSLPGSSQHLHNRTKNW